MGAGVVRTYSESELSGRGRREGSERTSHGVEDK